MTDLQTTESLQHFFGGDSESQPSVIEDAASDVGARIAAARSAVGSSQIEMANQLGVEVSTVKKWERGSTSPRANRLTALAGMLGVSLSWLIVGHGNEPSSVDDVAEIKVALGRVQTQLADTLSEVEGLMARLDKAQP